MESHISGQMVKKEVTEEGEVRERGHCMKSERYIEGQFTRIERQEEFTDEVGVQRRSMRRER